MEAVGASRLRKREMERGCLLKEKLTGDGDVRHWCFTDRRREGWRRRHWLTCESLRERRRKKSFFDLCLIFGFKVKEVLSQ